MELEDGELEEGELPPPPQPQSPSLAPSFFDADAFASQLMARADSVAAEEQASNAARRLDREARQRQQQQQRRQGQAPAAAPSYSAATGGSSCAGGPSAAGPSKAAAARAELAALRKQCSDLERAVSLLAGSQDAQRQAQGQLTAKRARVAEVEGQLRLLQLLASGVAPAAQESHRDMLIRTGKITPFQDTREARGQASRGVAQVASVRLARPVARSAESERGFQKRLSAKRRRSAPVPSSSKHARASTARHAAPAASAAAGGASSANDRVIHAQSDFEIARQLQLEMDAERQPRARSASSRAVRAADAGSASDGDSDGFDENWFSDASDNEEGSDDKEEQEEEEAEEAEDIRLDGGLRVAAAMHAKLLDYQQTGLRWLWELHCQRVGGIIGDEMGLGKTVQTIAFFAALERSSLLTSANLIVVPATLLRQWALEFAIWAPTFRVRIFHDSACAGVKLSEVMAQVMPVSGVVLTTYDQVRLRLDMLLRYDWHYVVLDEGHKIRNPHALVSRAVKQFDTPHRLILSGSPIQNSLKELWSLFDFIIPGKLGTLEVFQAEFELPITLGGYANASTVQVQTAYRCSVALRELVCSFLLRRMKNDVASSLPPKTEQILFCPLSEHQRTRYLQLLRCEDVSAVLAGKVQPFAAITMLRKVCNHPDLLQRTGADRPEDYGAMERSGKMSIAIEILRGWKEQGHKVLLFFQTCQMMDIFESFVQANQDWQYLRMDGTVAIGRRLAMIGDFNTNPDLFVFLLTTRVGGLGVNLTGADRVMLFDPDWNPSTDMQARERAWRLGQKRPVTIYRLLTSGTIEEKMYHRQVFKQMLTNKILKDPMQKRFFKSQYMHDLFTLDEADASDTKDMFADVDGGEVPQPSSAPPGGEGQLAEGVRSATVEDGGASDQAKSAKDNASILRNLFNGSSAISSAMSHDAIMADGQVDDVIIRQEANTIASEAVAAVARSRSSYERPAPPPSNRFGRQVSRHASGVRGAATGTSASSSGASAGSHALSSAELLRRMTGSAGTDSSDDELLARAIVDFLQESDGQCSSSEIASRFRETVSGPKMEIFRQVLRRIATNDHGAWRLKDEFDLQESA